MCQNPQRAKSYSGIKILSSISHINSTRQLHRAPSMAFSVFSQPFIHPQLHHALPKLTLFDFILFCVVHFVDKLGLWHRLPVLLGLAYLGLRRHLHQRYNLLHVSPLNGHNYDSLQFSYRTPDGTCNHPTDDLVGSQGTFFGRNMPPATSDYGVTLKFFSRCVFNTKIWVNQYRVVTSQHQVCWLNYSWCMV